MQQQLAFSQPQISGWDLVSKVAHAVRNVRDWTEAKLFATAVIAATNPNLLTCGATAVAHVTINSSLVQSTFHQIGAYGG